MALALVVHVRCFNGRANSFVRWASRTTVRFTCSWKKLCTYYMTRLSGAITHTYLLTHSTIRFLHERGYLELSDGSQDMTTQAAYRLLCQQDSSSDASSAVLTERPQKLLYPTDSYAVYAHLRQLGYVVRRIHSWTNDTPAVSTAAAASAARGADSASAPVAPAAPALLDTTERKEPEPSESDPSVVPHDAFHVWLPGKASEFKRSDPVRPDFVAVVTGYEALAACLYTFACVFFSVWFRMACLL